MQPEEEQGFTFVDKRGTTEPEANSAEEPIEAAEQPEPDADETEVEAGPTGPRHRLTVRDRFLMCIDILHQGAWIGMGLVPDPATGQMERDLAGAREAIDAVVFLAERVKDQIDDSTQRELQNLVNDLRLNYVRQANR